MADKESSATLSVNITRGLTDKLVERRKAAALELERTVKDLVASGDSSQIKQVIFTLEHDFTLSSNPNSRKGGLVGLAATSIALGRTSIGMHLPELVQPVLTCFEDQDARVRYYACESLYNISKVARGAVLVFFNNIFDGLCKLSCDSDSNVRYGAELLDRLMKDVVSENPHFDIDNFIYLLRSRIYTKDGFARQFLVSWISFLDSVPDIHMHEHVPEFLDGLFCILGDGRDEIKRLTEETLGELLKEIQQHSMTVRFDAMANIIALHCQSEVRVIQFTALTWLKVFIILAERSMMVFTSNFLVSILPCVAYDASKDSGKANIREVATDVNDRLKKLILPEDDTDVATDIEDKANDEDIMPSFHKPPRPIIPQPLPLTTKSGQTGQTGSTKASQSSLKLDRAGVVETQQLFATHSTEKTSKEKRDLGLVKEPPKFHLLSVLAVLIPHMKYTQQETRKETLRWVIWLHQQLPQRVYRQANKLFSPLLDMLADHHDSQYDTVACMALQVVSILSTSQAGMEPESSDPPPPQPTRGGTKAKESTGSSSSGKSSKLVKPPLAEKPAVALKPQVMRLNEYFQKFMIELLKMFDSDRALLENKGSFIIRQLCVYVGAHSVYCTLAKILHTEEKLPFASHMVQVLNMILFTASELYNLRMQLKDLASPESWNLFTTLYRSWCHNPVATVALCLLTQNYDHASNLVQKFANIEIMAGLLKEIDELVQLIESPIFSFLRLQLLVPQEQASLVRTLYGLLMLLPQSSAFNCLKQRLSCVSVIIEVEQEGKARRRKPQRLVPSSISFEELLEYFVSVQQKHTLARRKDRDSQHDLRTKSNGLTTQKR